MPNRHGDRTFFLTLLTAAICAWAAGASAQTIHTPKPGSPERQAICDATRFFVLSKYATSALPQPIVFKIGHFSVSGDYANFEVIPIFKDGCNIDADLLPDIGYNFCLRRVGGGWQVIADLSRSDVPDQSEMRAIRQSLRDFPLSLLSADWRNMIVRPTTGD